MTKAVLDETYSKERINNVESANEILFVLCRSFAQCALADACDNNKDINSWLIADVEYKLRE